MFRKSICIILIAGLFFQIGCATTKTVPVLRNEYDKLKEEKTIFVTVKSRQEYELIDFKITDTHIIGTYIIENERPPYTIIKKKIEIKLEDIEFIQVKKPEYSENTYFIMGFGFGVAIIAILFLLLK